MVRDHEFTAEVAQMGHGLQMWLQVMWFLSKCDENSTVILDEPDAYMHADLQRKLICMLNGMYKQVVIATHSIEIISEVNPDNILEIDKKNKHQKFATSNEIVQRIVDDIGSIQNIDLLKIASTKKALFTEGPKDDIKILNAFHTILYPNSSESLLMIPHIHIEGWSGWQRAIGGVQFIAKHQLGIMPYCIFDSDYHTEKEINKRKEDAQKRNISLHIWSKKEIENYLINPKVIHRVLKKKNIEISEETITKKIDTILSELEQETINNLIDALKNEDRSASTNELMKQVNKRNKNNQKGLNSIVCGKKVMSIISSWIQENYKTSISKYSVANAFQPEDISDEIKDVISKIIQNRPF